MSEPHPVCGGRSKGKDSGRNDLHIDLSALLAFPDQPQVPGENRSTRYGQEQDIDESGANQAQQRKKDDESIYEYPNSGRRQICTRATPCIRLDRDRDRLSDEESRDRRDHQVERCAAEMPPGK